MMALENEVPRCPFWRGGRRAFTIRESSPDQSGLDDENWYGIGTISTERRRRYLELLSLHVDQSEALFL
ncbi:unnamed protein product [Angiostrongylus costaricensis]|uniref:Uncharacterized protein n=1 Tax=Angiostrongylus costaricensis TaxID=334426 RepID=A0A0R3PJV7_ANGCS|nr:unnamed protein product [Angiostrongylus costaricensis]